MLKDETLIPLKRRDGTIIAHTKIDPADHAFVSQWTWRLHTEGYAVRSETINGTKQTIYMHRVINETPEGLVTDHINGDKLDNRRENLRSATTSQNNANSIGRPRRSRFRGVYYHTQAKKWNSQISIRGKNRSLGLYNSELEAARAYNEAANAHRPNFAILNNLQN